MVLGSLGVLAGAASATPLSNIVKIHAANGTCALTATGSAFCWTWLNYPVESSPQLSGVPVDPGFNAPLREIASGYSWCALTEASAVICRQNWDGVYRAMPGLQGGVSHISGHIGGTTCAQMSQGGVKCWGHNEWGQLGDGTYGTENYRPDPVDFTAVANVASLSPGYQHSCAVTTTGGAKCWGDNRAGELGNGTLDPYEAAPHVVAVDVAGLSSGVADVQTGYDFTCALTTAGGVKCWGQAYEGSVGDGIDHSVGNYPAGYVTQPVDVAGLASGVSAITVGGNHACALLSGGGVKCWGRNVYGALGDGTQVSRFAPVDVAQLPGGVTAISAGGLHTCALTNVGEVWCWGSNYSGEIGIGSSGPPVLLPTRVGVFTQQAITFAPIAPHTLVDPPFAVTASASSGLPVTFSSLTPSVCSVANATVTVLEIGVCTVAADQAGDGEYLRAPRVTRNFLVQGNVASSPTRLANLSTRVQVLQGESIAIAGFVIGGLAPKTVLIRAMGPSLAASGVAGTLANPTLSIFSGQYAIHTNDDWQGRSNANVVAELGLAPSDPRESAILVTLQQGSYTAIVSGVGGATGVALVEVYEIDRDDIPLINISTRGAVGTDEAVMIGGFVITGNSPQTVAITAKGPTLANYGIAGPLADPTLTLVRSSDHAVIAVNDDWGTASNAAQLQLSGFAPTHPQEAGILMTLAPGAYTAIVGGGGRGTGVGIVEVYAVQ